MKKNPALWQPFVSALLGLLFLFAGNGPLQAQSSAQAGDVLELQAEGKKPKILRPKARLALYGPVGTQPIKGRLVSAGDTIVLVPRNGGKQIKVPANGVTAVRQYRSGFQFLAGYYAYQVLISFQGFTILIASNPFGIPLGALLLLTIPGLVSSVGLLLLFAWLGARKYASPKWKIITPGK